MKKDHAKSAALLHSSLSFGDSNNFATSRVVASPVSLLDVAIRIGRVEQMLADNRAALRGAR